MDRFRRSNRTGLPVLVLAAVLALASVGLGVSLSHGRHLPAAIPARATTVEPLPDLALDLIPDSVEETASGGIVSLSLETASATQFETLSLVMKLPPHIVFTDGSKERTWEVTLDDSGRGVLPVDLIVDRRGRFHISAEAIGTIGQRTIRRGTAHPLVIGTSEPRPEVRNGAIEYRGLVHDSGGDR